MAFFRIHAKASGLIAALLVVLFSAGVAAEESDEAAQIVVLEPRTDYDLDLSGRIGEASSATIRGQDWFLEQVVNRGFQPKQILTRPEDLAWVMQGAGIAHIVYLPNRDGALLLKIVGEGGEQVHSETLLEDASVGLSDSEIDILVDTILSHVAPDLEKPLAIGDLEGEPDPEPEPETAPVGSREASVSKSMKTSPDDSSDTPRWLHFFVGADFTERVYVLTDRTLRSASLRTPMFPGYRAGVVAYPFWTSKAPARSAGFLVEFGQGFDNLTFVDGAERFESSATRLEVEAAFLYRFQGFNNTPYAQQPAIALRAGAHLASYTVATSLGSPLDSQHLAVDVGVRVEQALWVDWLGLEWDLLIHPYVGDISDDATGSQKWGLGLSTDASINVRLFAGAHLKLGWASRVSRTWYEGIAANNFEDLDVIIFEQSPRVALNYWW